MANRVGPLWQHRGWSSPPRVGVPLTQRKPSSRRAMERTRRSLHLCGVRRPLCCVCPAAPLPRRAVRMSSHGAWARVRHQAPPDARDCMHNSPRRAASDGVWAGPIGRRVHADTETRLSAAPPAIYCGHPRRWWLSPRCNTPPFPHLQHNAPNPAGTRPPAIDTCSCGGNLDSSNPVLPLARGAPPYAAAHRCAAYRPL